MPSKAYKYPKYKIPRKPFKQKAYEGFFFGDPPGNRTRDTLIKSSGVPGQAQQRIYPLEVAFLVLFWRAKKNEVTALQQLPSDKKIFRVLTGSCRGGTMESRRGEKTFKIYPPSARRTHHRDKVQSIPAVVAEERSGTTASHRKIFLSDGTRSILALDHSPYYTTAVQGCQV